MLCINTSGEPLPVPLTEEGAAVEATSAAEVARLLPGLLEGGQILAHARARQKEYCARNNHLLSGPAAPRVADVVLRISVPGGSALAETTAGANSGDNDR